jgi:hypothetical protein
VTPTGLDMVAYAGPDNTRLTGRLPALPRIAAAVQHQVTRPRDQGRLATILGLDRLKMRTWPSRRIGRSHRSTLAFSEREGGTLGGNNKSVCTVPTPITRKRLHRADGLPIFRNGGRLGDGRGVCTVPMGGCFLFRL